MSTTEIRQPSSFESIPLQTLTGSSMLPNDTEDVHTDIDTAQAQQEPCEQQSESSESTVNPVPEEAVSEHAELPPTEPNSVFDKWQLRLNATQVLIGVLAFAGFLAMIKFTIIDHHINNDSLKLSQWTAWMAFRDECRALLSETRDIGPDCQDVLYQPLSKPPIPMAESPIHDEKNITLAGRTARDNAKTRERLFDLHVLGVSIAELTLVSSIAVLSLAFGLGYVGYVATHRLFPRRKTCRTDTHHAWVPDHVARLEPGGSKGYATAKDTVSLSGTLRKRVVMRKITRIEEPYEESAIYPSFRKRPKPSTDTESLHENWDEASENDEKQENEGPDYESAWLPTARSSENDERHSPLAFEYLRTVELILAELKVLGYDYFAFDRVGEHAGVESFWAAAGREKCFCEFSRRAASSTLVQEIGNSDRISSKHVLKIFKTTNSFDGTCLVEFPNLCFDSVTVCRVYTICPRKKGARRPKTGVWRYWQSGKLGTGDRGFREAPCLRLMSTGVNRQARLFFENVTIQDYSFMLDRLGMDDSEQDHGRLLCSRLLSGGEVIELHTRVMKKVMLAANEGSLAGHVWPPWTHWQREDDLIFAGEYIEGEDRLYQIRESGKLVPIKQEDANDSTNSDMWSMHGEAPPERIYALKRDRRKESLITEDTIEPASGRLSSHQQETRSSDRSGFGTSSVPGESQKRSGTICSDPLHIPSPNQKNLGEEISPENS